MLFKGFICHLSLTVEVAEVYQDPPNRNKHIKSTGHVADSYLDGTSESRTLFKHARIDQYKH